MSSDKSFKNLTERERYLCEVSMSVGLVIGALIIVVSFMIWGGV